MDVVEHHCLLFFALVTCLVEVASLVAYMFLRIRLVTFICMAICNLFSSLNQRFFLSDPNTPFFCFFFYVIILLQSPFNN